MTKKTLDKKPEPNKNIRLELDSAEFDWLVGWIEALVMPLKFEEHTEDSLHLKSLVRVLRQSVVEE